LSGIAKKRGYDNFVSLSGKNEIMKKKVLILAGIAIAGFFGGIFLRGVTDSKGITKGTA
jgi:hypothetical protein